MTPANLDRMEAVAKAADETGERWRLIERVGSFPAVDTPNTHPKSARRLGQTVGSGGYCRGVLGVDVNTDDQCEPPPNPRAIGEHIATFDPPTALSLIARIRTLERALDKAEVALAPFASLAATPDNEGANMNDPLRKWFTVANLYEAHEALTALRASREPLDHDGEG